MKVMSVGEFKRDVSRALESVCSGESVAVTYGRKKDIVGVYSRQIRRRPRRCANWVATPAAFVCGSMHTGNFPRSNGSTHEVAPLVVRLPKVALLHGPGDISPATAR